MNCGQKYSLSWLIYETLYKNKYILHCKVQLTKEYLCTSNKETDWIFGTLYVEIIIVIDAFINIYDAMLKGLDNMKQPAAILVLQYWYYNTGTTILVHNTGNTSILPVSSSICNTGTDTGKY
jgi:hypothetical protein